MFETGFSLTLTELVHCWLLTFGLWDQSLASAKTRYKYHNILRIYGYRDIIDRNICIAKNDLYRNNTILFHFIEFGVSK